MIPTFVDKIDPVVFLGPSLPRAEAEGLLRAEFRPPIRRGDLETCGEARLILIIDGEFDQNFPVSPKEILRALDAGRVVVGASSMGALRASELAPEGMIGIGQIYEAYRAGWIEGDDEVALSYCPLSFEPRTVPLVNVRFWLDRLEAEGLVTAVERSTILRRARRVFHADRTPTRLSLVVAECLGADRLGAIAEAGFGEIPDLKAQDARTALSAVARMIQDPFFLQETRTSMSQGNFQDLIGKALIDADFRDLLFSDRDQALQGYSLTPDDVAVLDTLTPEIMNEQAARVAGGLSTTVMMPSPDPGTDPGP